MYSKYRHFNSPKTYFRPMVKIWLFCCRMFAIYRLCITAGNEPSLSCLIESILRLNVIEGLCPTRPTSIAYVIIKRPIYFNLRRRPIYFNLRRRPFYFSLQIKLRFKLNRKWRIWDRPGRRTVEKDEVAIFEMN